MARLAPAHHKLALTGNFDCLKPCVLSGFSRGDIRFAHMEPDFVLLPGLGCQAVGAAPNALAATFLIEFDGHAGGRAQSPVVRSIDPSASRAPIAIINVPELFFR